MDFDSWLTADPSDAALCDHGRVKPCWECWMERAEQIAEAEREEKDE